MPDRNSAKLSMLAPPLNQLALQIDPIRYSSIGAGSLAGYCVWKNEQPPFRNLFIPCNAVSLSKEVMVGWRTIAVDCARLENSPSIPNVNLYCPTCRASQNQRSKRLTTTII